MPLVAFLTLMLWWVAVVPARAGCVVDALASGTQVPWDQRDGLARRVESAGPALGLSTEQIARLASALRMGRVGAGFIDAPDLAELARFDGTCDPPAPDAATPSYGFDLHLGWPHLVGSAGVAGLALGGLAVLARMRARAQRQNRRYFCKIAGHVRVSGGDWEPCRVTDVSLGGARLTLRGALVMTVGQTITVDFGQMRMDASVVSANRSFVGVDFTRHLSRAELLHLVRPEKYPVPVSQLADVTKTP